MLKEFKEFALKGNVLDLAVGIIIGAAFTAVVNSLVKDILTPPLGILQESAKSLEGVVLPIAGIEFRVGAFINAVITFTLTAFAVFLLIKGINAFKKKEEAPAPAAPDTRECPYCISTIPVRATRCPACTAEVPPATASGGTPA
ncbi:MAG TPA: large conductance mechanosensitive channel protein MscL [Chthoniobacteraceae bacterium]|nr:large conductance mechanosensitive channel protein MscL [Chthoniobacteraceae bacterium]